MDSAQASLNTVAQRSSLEYVYKDIFTSTNSVPSLSTQVNIDINKSVAFCDNAMMCLQTQSEVSNILTDGMSTFYKDGQWWFTLGSNQYPNQKIDDVKIAYHQSLQTYDKLNRKDLPTSVGLNEFGNTAGIYAVSLERDTSLALSQSPVNASRALRFELSYTVAPTVPLLATIYMTYITSARSSLLSSRVDV